MGKSNQNRRQFLRNTTLAALTVVALPSESTAVSMANNEDVSCNKTTTDYYGQGPFYSANAPEIIDNNLAKDSELGTRLILSGRVLNMDCTQFIPNTLIDIWHADDAGRYDNLGYNLRGKTLSNAQGFYFFETIMPGKYLNGGKFRPAHIHFKITPPGFEELITQLYFEGDVEIPTDAAASITSGDNDATDRIIPLTKNDDGKMEGVWDIMINGEGNIVSTSDIHTDKGMIYSISPNPYKDRIEISYGVFTKAKVSLAIYDAAGREVAKLREQELIPEKYTAEWRPNGDLKDGYYFVSLKINDLQVHYKKIIRKR